MNYPKLFSPLKIKNLTLKNRSVLPGLTSNYSSEKGEVTEQLIEFLKKRAEGGAGLIFVESVFVDWSGKAAPRQPGIHDDHLVEGFKKLTSAVHGAGAKIMPQLVHCGRQMTSSFSKMQLWAPSAIPDPVVGEIPIEMTLADINYIADQFAQAARRSKEAEFDGIEIQAGHGYLISEFLSPYANKRKDDYGGSFENRFRFLKEILKRIRELVGDEFPIACRFNAEEYVDEGIHLAEAIQIAQEMEKYGVDFLDVSVSVKESYHYLSATSGEPTANQSDLAAVIKKNVNIPVITAGRVITPEIAESVLSEGKADLVAIGRGFIADPNFIKKAEQGKSNSIIPCIGCNACNARSHRPQIICTVNSTVGREAIQKNAKPDHVKLTVGIIGSSIAGLEAAKVASDKGHQVTIFEPSTELGGLFACVRPRVPGQEELGKAKVYYESILKERDNVTIHLEADVSSGKICELDFDKIYISLKGDIDPYYENVNAPFAIDILQVDNHFGDEYTIIGRGILAAETALYLADKGKQVTLVYDQEPLIHDAHPTISFYTQIRLNEKNIDLIKVESITGETFKEYKNPIQTHTFKEGTIKKQYHSAAEQVVYLGDSYEASNLAERVWDAGDSQNTVLERKI